MEIRELPWLWLADGAALLLLAGYHWRLLQQIRQHPERTAIGRNRITRRRWLSDVIERRADILAVQTLRNWAMTATFLASTAILIAVGIVHFIFVNEPGATAATRLLRADFAGAKLFLLASVFFAAFFCFAQTLRALNHLGFEIVVAGEDDFDSVLRHLHRHSDNFSLGMRCYYLSLPFSLWLFGALHLLAATIIMVLLMRRLDYRHGGGLARAS
ncbi:MAG: DUF599 domain-containing protein [Gammaproteobacteria bacterium]